VVGFTLVQEEICLESPVKREEIMIITKGLKKYLETIPGKHSIDSLKKQLYYEHHTL
jgi:hypothetical protein